jgi:ABC-2 type transport system ATP-binding protein
MNDVVIETYGLTKHYGRFVAVDSLDLTIRRGEVYGLLGPNGSGKTTTILMLIGLTDPTAGRVRVLGFDPTRRPLEVKARVGYLPDQVGFYDRMTGRENLAFSARLMGLPRPEAESRIGAGLAQAGLSAVADNPVATYSRGMRQRLGLAELLLKRPEIAIMDEPTLGLDPEVARALLQTIRDLKGQGMTLLLSSHLLHQVQEICDRVGLFRQGRLRLEGTVEELARQVLGGGYRVRLDLERADDALVRRLSSLDGVAQGRRLPQGGVLLEAGRDVRAEAARVAVEAGAGLRGLSIEQPSLDEIYARYFQEAEHAQAA